MNFSFRALMWTAVIGAASLAMATPAAIAAPIVQYQIGGTSNSDLAKHRKATTVGPDVTATSITNGTGMVVAGTIFRETPANGDDWAIFQKADSFGGADTEAKALAQNTYWSFTVDPVGDPISVAELTFDTLYYNANANATVFVRSSVDNYATNLGGTTFATNTVTRTPRSIALSSDFQDLDDAVEFRFYLFAPVGSSGLTGGVDNITLNVPEPATLGLLGLGALVVLRRQRR